MEVTPQNSISGMDSHESNPTPNDEAQAKKTETQLKLDETKAKVEEVVDIMRMNVDRIVLRGDNLTDVDQRADALHQSAMQFQEKSHQLEAKQWWANVKMRIALAVVGLAFITVVVVWIVYG